MKKNLVFVTILLFAFTAGYSQIKINTSGYVGINNLNPSFNLDCNGTSFFNVVPTYDWGIHIESAGFMGGAAIYPQGPSSLGLTNQQWHEGYIYNLYQGSDARFKTNVKTMDNALLNIMKVRSVTYDFSDYFIQKSPAGCVAVAMAQVANYWRHPVHPTYQDYDWCNMPNSLYVNVGKHGKKV